jgi:hypothetical protein
MKPKSPRRRQPSMRQIAQEMMDELRVVFDQAGDDPAARVASFRRYVEELSQRHPDWRPIMRRFCQRQSDRILNPKVRRDRNASKHRKP